MNERRRFLKVVGAGAVAVGTGCGGVDDLVVGDGGTGGTGTGGTGTGGTGTTTTTTTTTTTCATPAGTAVGKPSTYAATGLHIVADKGVLIGRDSGGLYALTSICTHQGCDMSTGAGQISGPDIVCLCHHSVFSSTGTVVSGPAHSALKAYALELGCDGNLYVNKSEVVASTVRLMA